MKKICIVTGGAGFIGSHLCEKLLNTENKVVCIDNLLTGREENLKEFKNHPDFQFIKFDLNDKFNSDILAIVSSADYVFHLASPASPNKLSNISYIKLPIETLLVNSWGTYQILANISTTKAKFLFASTSEIYGDPIQHPQTENYWGNVNPIGERSCYDEAKRFGEAITSTYIRKYNLDGRIIRIFNTFGPKMRDDGRAVIEFINAVVENKPIYIFGKGTQTRSFCYISDLIEGICKAMFVEGTKGEVINLGNPNEVTIIDLAKKIIQMTNSSSKLEFRSLPSDDPKRRCPDITKAKNLLEWEPAISLDSGLEKTVNYIKLNK